MSDDYLPPELLDLGTAEAASKVLKTFFNIAKAWKLSAEEEEALLDVDPRTCGRWRSGKVESAVPVETLVRVAYLLKIYASLKMLFPAQDRADGWVRRPNTAPLFSGESALNRMLAGAVGDLKVVSDYLDAALGGDF